MFCDVENSIFVLQKDVAQLEEADFYGAWEIEVSETENRVMMFMETNDIYPNAATTNAIVIFQITETDTVLAFQGSFEIIEGYLKTTSGGSIFANEILEFTNRKLTLYTDASDDFQRVWRKVKTDWLSDNPLD